MSTDKWWAMADTIKRPQLRIFDTKEIRMETIAYSCYEYIFCKCSLYISSFGHLLQT